MCIFSPLGSHFSLAVNSLAHQNRPTREKFSWSEMDLHAWENGFAGWQARKDPLIVIFAPHLFGGRVKEESERARCCFAPFQRLQMHQEQKLDSEHIISREKCTIVPEDLNWQITHFYCAKFDFATKPQMHASTPSHVLINQATI